jgi:hypothetical protein
MVNTDTDYIPRSGGGGGATGYTTGNYTGNDSANRAIAHGLGSIPSIILIFKILGTCREAIITSGVAKICRFEGNRYDVSAPDATNFYVGEATSYEYSMNCASTPYKWIAFA